MAKVRTINLPHYTAYPVHICMFKDVKNAAFLRKQLLEANPEFDYAFLDPTMILTPQHILSATLLSLHLHLTSRAKTRTPHSELVFRLHPNNNIGESYRKFGISDDSDRIIAVKLSLTPEITNESVGQHLGSVVEGESVDVGEGVENVGMWCDVEKVKKVYKLDSNGGKGREGGTAVNGNAPTNERKEMEAVMSGVITLKGS
ncbi:protein CGI121 [Lojkania enalia]|uniref:EKC/KEOPS complex subunit CGI121 n=1 Tax=Lojkania enalia TaxID=147567 RepID=A0A9P4KC54_9PLEO|nr:protein CGI121 [Didymosphaeria enalia]